MPGSVQKILLVEDEAVIALAESGTLRRGGYEVSVAASGEKAIELVDRGEELDLILMDIDLGIGMDGTQAAEEILKRREIPVVFLSSHTEPEVVARTDRITSYGYVVKNSGPTVLFASIKMAFRLHQARRELMSRERRLAEALAEKDRVEAALEKRLVVLTRPLESGVRGLRFDDLFDVAEVQKIQDAFAQATGVASLITEPDGTPITRPSNFCRLCGELVRKTEKGFANCMHSDAVLGAKNPGGPIVQRCLSAGLYDGGASISAGERHIANWLIGQVLEEGEDQEAMLRYAEEIGVDAGEYRRALSGVTRMPRARFEAISEALFLIAGQLSKLALQNVQQAQYISRLGGDRPAGAAPAERSATPFGAARPEPGEGEPRSPSAPEPGAEAIRQAAAATDWRLRFSELQHRVKNSFSIIDALVGFQLDLAEGTERESLETLRGRVSSIARLYELLYRAPEDKLLRLDLYLDDVAGAFEAAAKCAVARRLQPVEIPPGRAIPLGLVLNEALTNSFKYASRAGRGPAMLVSLTPARSTATLVVSDDGPGFDPGARAEARDRPVHGLTLAKLLIEQLGGSTTIDSVPGAGTRIEVTFPI